MFAIFSFMIAPMIYLFYPETANRTLEDMDQIFIHNPSVFVCWNRFATQSQRPQSFKDAEVLRVAQADGRSQDAALPDCKKEKTVDNVVEV